MKKGRDMPGLESLRGFAEPGLPVESVWEGARRVQDQCDVPSLTSAASIACEIFQAMRKNAHQFS